MYIPPTSTAPTPKPVIAAQPQSVSGGAEMATFLKACPNIEKLANNGGITPDQLVRLKSNPLCAELVDQCITFKSDRNQARVENLLGASKERLGTIKEKLGLMDEIRKSGRNYSDEQWDKMATASVPQLKRLVETHQIVDELIKRDPNFSDTDLDKVLSLGPAGRKKFMESLRLEARTVSSAAEPSALRGQQVGRELHSRTQGQSTSVHASARSTTGASASSLPAGFITGMVMREAWVNMSRPASCAGGRSSSSAGTASNSNRFLRSFLSWLDSMIFGPKPGR